MKNFIYGLFVGIIVSIIIFWAWRISYQYQSQTWRQNTPQYAKNQACEELVRYDCAVSTNTINIANFDSDQDGYTGANETGSGWNWDTSTCGGSVATSGDNLAALCYCHFGRDNEVECKQLCGCLVS